MALPPVSLGKGLGFAGGGLGGSGGSTILLNMWLKGHGFQALTAEEATAVMTAIWPIIVIVLLISAALLVKFLKFIRLEVPGLTDELATVIPGGAVRLGADVGPMRQAEGK